jgi:hypothetical protein
MSDQDQYVVTLEAVPGNDSGIAGLRKFLKFALRVCGLKCVRLAKIDRTESSVSRFDE